MARKGTVRIGSYPDLRTAGVFTMFDMRFQYSRDAFCVVDPEHAIERPIGWRARSGEYTLNCASIRDQPDSVWEM